MHIFIIFIILSTAPNLINCSDFSKFKLSPLAGLTLNRFKVENCSPQSHTNGSEISDDSPLRIFWDNGQRSLIQSILDRLRASKANVQLKSPKKSPLNLLLKTRSKMINRKMSDTSAEILYTTPISEPKQSVYLISQASEEEMQIKTVEFKY